MGASVCVTRPLLLSANTVLSACHSHARALLRYASLTLVLLLVLDLPVATPTGAAPLASTRSRAAFAGGHALGSHAIGLHLQSEAPEPLTLCNPSVIH